MRGVAVEQAVHVGADCPDDLPALVLRGQAAQRAGHGLRERPVLVAERDAHDPGPVGRRYGKQPRRLTALEACRECRRRFAVFALRVCQAGARERHPRAVALSRVRAGTGFGGAEVVFGLGEVTASDLHQCQYGAGLRVRQSDLEFARHHQAGLGFHGRVVQRSLFEECAGTGGMPVG